MNILAALGPAGPAAFEV